jgi:hypothetical protein
VIVFFIQTAGWNTVGLGLGIVVLEIHLILAHPERKPNRWNRSATEEKNNNYIFCRIRHVLWNPEKIERKKQFYTKL